METEKAMVTVNEGRLTEQETKALDIAKAMVIRTPEDFQSADQFCVKLASLEKLIKNDFAPAKDAAFQAHRAITAQEKAHLEKVQEPRRLVKGKMSEWQDAQEVLRREEEKRQQDAARKQAEEDALAAAIESEKSGDMEQAEAIIAAPVQVAAVVLEKSTPKSATVLRKIWTYRIINEGMVPRSYLMVDTSRLGQQARATQDTIKVPGVEFYQKAV